MGLEVVEKQGPARSHAAGDCGGEKRLTGLRILFGLQGVNEGFSGHTRRVLLCVPLIKGAAGVAGKDNDGILKGNLRIQKPIA
ncbi:hypothetical protein SDC9_132770 [bioreactor metagenome]|uniref:Uncharacterized protein n=1 Tax=bioreactor metagenome TaxID=1076179 RepID=A0A645D935_9ZZZZ